MFSFSGSCLYCAMGSKKLERGTWNSRIELCLAFFSLFFPTAHNSLCAPNQMLMDSSLFFAPAATNWKDFVSLFSELSLSLPARSRGGGGWEVVKDLFPAGGSD